jgi:hypothetical protein
MYETCFDDAILHVLYYKEGAYGGTLASTLPGHLVSTIGSIVPDPLAISSHLFSVPAMLNAAPTAGITVPPIFPIYSQDHAARELELHRENHELRQINYRLQQ